MRDPQAVSSMLCPVCSTGLAMSDRQGVEIDYCPQCRGVWLDRGELDKIIERSQREQPVVALQPQEQALPTSRDGYRDDSGHSRSRHGSGHGGGKLESFLKRLFD